MASQVTHEKEHEKVCVSLNTYLCLSQHIPVSLQTHTFVSRDTYLCLSRHIQPIPLGVTFSKAQSSQLERLFCHVSVKRDVRALSFELWNSIRKCHPKRDWLYLVSRDMCLVVPLWMGESCHASCDIWRSHVYSKILWWNFCISQVRLAE